MKIEDKKVVSFHYTLKDKDGKVLDSSGNRGEPLQYLHGANNIIPGLEKELLGLEPGAQKHVEVEPEQGYGLRREDLVVDMPRQNIDFKGDIVAGMQFYAQTPEGMPIALTVVSVDEAAGTIKLDGNHPMAGVKLFFDVEIVDVRDAGKHELMEGRPHQPTCSCGCHGGDDGCCHDQDGGHDCKCGKGDDCCCGDDHDCKCDKGDGCSCDKK
ncbi:MAG: peptidylprolyl isomerase [Opitutales bacterium]|nr:peptidylprolyl isomerase [Opitutales bacterium]